MSEQESDTTAAMWEHFFELYAELPRGGPGDPASARRAVSLMPGLPRHPRVLDLGCGPGTGSRALAELTSGRVTAFDLHAPFVSRQVSAPVGHVAAASGALVDGVCGTMSAAPFAAGTFDLVWAEGALYSIGFTRGLAAAFDLVRPGGYLAASEAVWTVAAPPEEVRRWWEHEYPDITPISSKLADVSAAGFAIVAHFTLPPSAWRDEYYAPIRRRLAVLRTAWATDEVGLQVIAQLEHEADMFDRFGDTYGYEFVIGRRP